MMRNPATSSPITADDLARAKGIAAKACGGRRWLIEDAQGEALVALVLAARDFDGRGTFAGYSGQRMRRAVLDWLRTQDTRGEPGGAAWQIAHPVSMDALGAQEQAAQERTGALSA